MKKSFFVIAVMLCFLWVSQAFAVSGGIEWKAYEKGVTMAKEEGKKVFLYFHADWCTYCRKMEHSTFKDLGIIAYLNDNFISIMVDTETEKKMSDLYGVRGLPTSWFLKSNSEKLSNMPGYVDSARLLLILKYINTESYDKMSFRDFEDSL